MITQMYLKKEQFHENSIRYHIPSPESRFLLGINSGAEIQP